jgi:diguanylate cyclase (GGDEF)-like protein
MRIRRPMPKPGTVPRKVASGTNASALRVLDQRTPSTGEHGAVGDSAGGRVGASLEAMFEEISSADLGGGKVERPTFATRYDELWQLSLADPLTGLANRMLLLDRLTRELTRCRRHGGCVIVSHIDLGNLRDINHELGYTSGNEVLRGMTRRLTSMLRSEDTVSRVGESELVAVMTIEDEQFVGPLMQRVQGVLDNPIPIADGQVRVSAILGTVVARTSESAEEVLARAGSAA